MKVLTHYLLWKVGIASAETQTSERERDCLARYASGKKNVVEIGVWHGVNTLRMRSVMNPEGELFAVDPFPTGKLGISLQQLIARKEIGKTSNGKVRWMRERGCDAAKNYTALGIGPVDFIFIDGDHSLEGIRGDWEAWAGLVNEGGLVALHDSCSSKERCLDGAGSAQFTQQVIVKDKRFSVMEVVDTLTVLKRL